MRHTNLNSLRAFKKDVTVSGTPEMLAPQQTAKTIAFNDNSATSSKDTITDSDSQFLVNGFEAGDIINITGSTSNNIQAEIYSVTAGTITIVKMARLTTEVAGDTVIIDLLHGRKVEDGVGVVVKAKHANTGAITIASTSALALNTNSNYDSNFSLYADQSFSLQVKNLNQIWMDATVSGEGVEIIFER